MPGINRTYKGTFFVKARSKTHLPTDGNQYAIWAKLIPSNMIISKYWVNATVRSEDSISDANLSPMETNLSGFLSNIPITGSSYGGGEIANIDVSDPLDTALDQLGVLPSSANPYIQETGDDIDIAQGVSYARYWQDRRFFDREKTLSFPKNAIITGENNYKLFDQFSTSGTRLGQNSDYKQPRMLSFIFTSDNQLTTNMHQNSRMLVGAAGDSHDINIAEWDRQAQTVFDPLYAVNPDWHTAGTDTNPYFETIGDLDGGSIGSDAAGGSSDNLHVPAEDTNDSWAVNRWMRSGYTDGQSNVVQDVNIDFFIDLQVTLQCQMYIPGHRKTVTLP